jgi:acyl transferase domain-containing protein/acyl carrier protein
MGRVVTQPLSAEALTSWLVARVAAMREIDPRSVDVHGRFSEYGLDSLGAARIVAELGEALGRRLSPTLVWEYPTFTALVGHLTGRAESPSPAEAAPAERETGDPIAIVGMACRFPQSPDPASFWRLLRAGGEAISGVPADRGWDDTLTALGVERAERAKVSRGGFLERIDGFDPLFFGISPREAISMDPQQRLMLELSWEALEDAAIRPSSLRGSAASVFAGAIWLDYGIRFYRGGAEGFGQYTVTGYHHSIIANRISYLLGLEGVSFTVDSACSSGLVVVHLACESLRRGESTLALAGAVNLNVLPESAVGVSRFGALSEDGRCYSFDARANGYVRGEGGGVLVLKTLSRAIADGDPVHCVIRGSAVNNDGASNGLTAPNRKAQEAVLRAAYRRAGVDASAVQYVEAHGTGTPLGDPIEARALGAVLGAARPADAPLLIGSAKTNIGHLEGAAGLVGLVKVALAIEHRQLPPSLNFVSANPHAPLAELHLAVPTSLQPWPVPERKLLAGVSSFGLGGTNGHVVLEEWPAPRAELLSLAASSARALHEDAERLRASLSADAGRTPLSAICADAAAHCGVSSHRLSLLARSHAGAERSLDAFLRGEKDAALHGSEPGLDASRGVVFVCPGQGAQWFGMARSLLQGEPVFRATLEQCDPFVRRYLGWSLIEELTRPRAVSRLDDIEVSLPVIISIDIAAATWWRSLGVEPAAVVGHSTGEIAAAYIAGALDLDDTMRIICAYGRVIGRRAGQGGMMLAALPWDEAAGVLAGFEGRVFRAIQDSAGATVFAGEPAALAVLLRDLQSKGVFCRAVSMNVSPHCPLVDALRDELFESLQGIRPRRGTVPLISEVTGAEIDGSALDAAHWVRNFGDPALFSGAVDTLIGRGHRVFVDVGPHPITKHSVETNLKHAGVRGVVLSSLRRDEDERGVLLDTLGALHALGAPVRWDELYPVAGAVPSRDAWLLPLSARSPQALTAMAGAYGALLRGGEPPLRDLVFTASVRRDHHAHRLAIAGRTREELAEALSAFARGEVAAGTARGRVPGAGAPKVVFVFPGQGSQWLGMGRQLLAEEPAFRAAIEAVDEVIRKEAGFSVLEQLAAEESGSRLHEIDVVQPALFAIEVALAALWRSWGVEPDAVVGHSMGEVAAAHVAGILGLEDAAKVICRRSRLLRRVSGKGAMGLVELTFAEAEKAIAHHRDRLGVAVSNGPRSTVISGDPAALEEVLATLEKRGVFCRRVKVDVASHSPQMDPLREDLLAALSDLRPGPARLVMWSTVTGEAVEGPELDAGYWAKNLRAPVLFSSTTQHLMKTGHGLFVEISPHPILLPSVEENLREVKREGAAIASVRRGSDERRAMLEALGALYAHGLDVGWARLFPRGGRLASLPAYPWQRERCWVDDDPRAAAGPRRARGAGRGHPLLGEAFVPADRPDTHYWEQSIRADEPAYLADHRVQGEVVFPGAAYVEMALAAAAAVHGLGDLVLEDVSFERMLSMSPSAERRVQVALVEEDDGGARITVSSRDEGGGEWLHHARARARLAVEEAAVAEPLGHVRERCPTVVEGAEHLARMAARQVEYGPAFQGLTRIQVGEGEALGHVHLPEAAGRATGYLLHPALLDACFQVSTALVSASERETVVPVEIERVRVHARPPEEVWVSARLVNVEGDASQDGGSPSRPPGRDTLVDLALVGADGRPFVEILGLRLKRLNRASADAFVGCAYTVGWRRKDLPANDDARGRSTPGTWIVFADGRGFGASVARLLRQRGEACIEVSAGERPTHESAEQHVIDPSKPEHYQRILRAATSGGLPLRGIVHAWSLDANAEEHTTPDTLLADVRRGTWSALRVVQEVVSQGLRDVPRLVLVTRGAQPVPGDTTLAVAQAPILGLGRTIALEQPDLACVRIDLAPEPRANEAELLVREILSGSGEDQVALRGEGRFVARLERGDPEPAEAPSLEAQATYLITGGLGGLGLALARWMVARGARHLALVGRNAPSAAAREAIDAMAEAGAEVRTVRGDVAHAADVRRILDEVREHLPPLRGVVHAAGVLEDRMLQGMTEEQFWAPIRPKIFGAWNLHEATLHTPLDFFVMYSSAASLLGSPGQGNYAAANAFLEALAHLRVGLGLPAMAIQWGAFSDVGLAAAQENRGQRLSYRGLESLTPDEGTELFSRMLQRPPVEVGLVRMSVRQWMEFYPRTADSPFLAELHVAEERAAAAGPAEGATGRLRDALEHLSPAEARLGLERHVLECLSRVLRVPADRVDVGAPFKDYGMDSLMSLEIRNRLEASLGLRLSAAILFTHPTTTALVEHLLADMQLGGEALDQSMDRLPDEGHPDLTEEVAAAMLDERLQDLEDYLR